MRPSPPFSSPVRALLVALLLWAAPSWAQSAGAAQVAPSGLAAPLEHPHHVAERSAARTPPLVPAPRPPIVTGEIATARFRILHTRRSEPAARELAARIEQARDSLRHFLGRDWPGVTEIRLGADREEMAELALPGGAPPSWAVALAYPAHNVILLNAATLGGAEGVDTLWHELAHVALGRLGVGWPHWFQEGLAVHLTGSRFDTGRYATLFQAVRADAVLNFTDLAHGWPTLPGDVEVAYAQSADFVGWLSTRHGGGGISRLVEHVVQGDTFEVAFAKAFQSTLTQEVQAWTEGLPGRFGWLPVATTGTLVMGLTALLCVAAWVRRRKQLAIRLAEMEAQDAAEEAARRLLEAELAAQEAQLLALRDGPPQHWLVGAGDDDWDPEPPPGKPTLH